MSRRAHGDGSIFQRSRDGKWVATIELPRTPGGKRVRRSFVADTMREAKGRLRAAQREVDSGKDLTTRPRSIADVLEWWLAVEILPSDRSQSTKVGHETNIRLHLEPVLGRLTASRVDPVAVREVLVVMQRKDLSKRTQQSALVTLKSAFKYAVENGVLDRNPAASVRSPRPVPDPERVHDIPLDQLVRLIDASRDEPLHAYWVVLATTGARKAEALALRWRDVDLDSMTLRFERSMFRLKGKGLQFKALKTASARRTAPVPAMTVDALRLHRSRQQRQRLAAGPLWQDHDLVFCGAVGQPLDLKVPNVELARICAAVGLRPERVHNWRHSVATVGGIVTGGDMHIVSKQLGHASITTTMDMYRHAVTAAQRRLADGMGCELDKARRDLG